MDRYHKTHRLHLLATLFSILFALAGFSYNAWRLEATEKNATLRPAAFQILTELAELERTVFAAHYDQDPIIGNPRNGWVKILLIDDLAMLTNSKIAAQTKTLKAHWNDHWRRARESETSAALILKQIDQVRLSIRESIQALS